MNKTSAKTSAKKDEALHKALKVLNCLNNDRVYETTWVKGAINACEEALEQPAQHKWSEDGERCVKCGDKDWMGGSCSVADEQPSQEPMAWIKQGMDGYPKLVFNGKFEYESISAKWGDIPLYTKEQL